MLKLLTIFVAMCLLEHVVLSIRPRPYNPDRKKYYKDEDVEDLFKEFVDKYYKFYKPTEVAHRRKVFRDNLMHMNYWNFEHPEAIFGIGPYADLTFEEFTGTHFGCLANFTRTGRHFFPQENAPDKLDWRDKKIVTGVKNQARCGSCYIFSAIGNIESQYAKKTGKLIELSEQQCLDCLPSKGCNGGLPHTVMQQLTQRGCMKGMEYPYEGRKYNCLHDEKQVVVKVKEGIQYTIRSEEDLKDALYNMGPLSIGIHINPPMQHLKEGIYNPKSCKGQLHAALLVGYNTDFETPYWIIKNSWGEEWNTDGYLQLIRGHGACGIGMYVASAEVE